MENLLIRAFEEEDAAALLQMNLENREYFLLILMNLFIT
jgi:hypothetical protein